MILEKPVGTKLAFLFHETRQSSLFFLNLILSS